jgi:hypothetical protein
MSHAHAQLFNPDFEKLGKRKHEDMLLAANQAIHTDFNKAMTFVQLLITTTHTPFALKGTPMEDYISSEVSQLGRRDSGFPWRTIRILRKTYPEVCEPFPDHYVVRLLNDLFKFIIACMGELAHHTLEGYNNWARTSKGQDILAANIAAFPLSYRFSSAFPQPPKAG